MKWFKHNSNANTSPKLNLLIDKYGLNGYARYWLLIELLADKFNGSTTSFTIHWKTLARQLRYNKHTSAKQWLNYGETLGLYSYRSFGDVFTIDFPKLSEIRDNHTKSATPTSKQLGPREEQNRREEIRETKSPSPKNKDSSDTVLKDVLELWNSKAKDLGIPIVKTLGDDHTKKFKKFQKEYPTFQHWKYILTGSVDAWFISPKTGELVKFKFRQILEKNRVHDFHDRGYQIRNQEQELT